MLGFVVYAAFMAAHAANGPSVVGSHAETRVLKGRIEAPPRSDPREARTETIRILPDSRVCVSVHVDQGAWPTRLLPGADQFFSTFLSGELARVYRERGGSYHLPGRDQTPRFLANPEGTNPQCRRREQDIEISIRYSPRPDGRPFIVSYRIAQRGLTSADVAVRDIEADWRSGRLTRAHHTEPLQIAVTEDMRTRAASLIQDLTEGE